jgi:hypothetical protein
MLTPVIPVEQARKELPEDERIYETCDIVNTEFDTCRDESCATEPSALLSRGAAVEARMPMLRSRRDYGPATPELIEDSNASERALATRRIEGRRCDAVDHARMVWACRERAPPSQRC